MRLALSRSIRGRSIFLSQVRRPLKFECRQLCLRQLHLPAPVNNPPATTFYDASKIAMTKQWKIIKEQRNKRRKVERPAPAIVEGSHDEILQIEATELILKSQPEESEPTTSSVEISDPNHAPAELGLERELKVVELSSTGDGLALSEDGKHVYVIPFAVPGDIVLAKEYPQVRRGPYTHTDLVKVVKPSLDRDEALIRCKYFGKCAGCQFQMLPYESQLAHKKSIVEKAFRNFSGLKSSQIPPVADTIGSPMQYGYRTKLSPHFDGPPRKTKTFTEPPAVGFTAKGRKKVMDIESCPIGTDILQEGLKSERAKVIQNMQKYTRGATILLRESTSRTSEPSSPKANGRDANSPLDGPKHEVTKELTTTSTGDPLLLVQTPTHVDAKTCVTDNNAVCTEYISGFKFTSRAGSFFQNNNSILPRFTEYVRTNAFPPILDPQAPPIKYLLDAYCGSGLFAVTLASLFTSVLGIDIDPKGIEAARANAKANSIPNAGFIEADAPALFADVPFPPAQTLVVIDPPRKGASADFLNQLMHFGPKRVIYVSCNVHTQARDIGVLVNGASGSKDKGKAWRYEIESLRGFDFFPQTGHVEGVAFLSRVEEVA